MINGSYYNIVICCVIVGWLTELSSCRKLFWIRTHNQNAHSKGLNGHSHKKWALAFWFLDFVLTHFGRSNIIIIWSPTSSYCQALILHLSRLICLQNICPKSKCKLVDWIRDNITKTIYLLIMATVHLSFSTVWIPHRLNTHTQEHKFALPKTTHNKSRNYEQLDGSGSFLWTFQFNVGQCHCAVLPANK